MVRIRAFFLTAGLGLMAFSVMVLIYRPEPADMRYREFLGMVMTAGFIFGFFSLLIFSNRWRKVNLLGAVLFGLGLLTFYLGGRYGGQSMGSTGWVIGLILIGVVFPTALIMMGIAGLASLGTMMTAESGSKTGAFWGAALTAAVVAVLVWMMMMSPNVDELITSLHDTKAEVRNPAIHQLGQLDNIKGRNALIGLLRDPDPAIRAEAAEALGQSPSRHMVIDPLTKALEDENSQVRQNAALSLGAAIGAGKRKMYSRAAEGLLARLKDDSPDVRAAAAEALGWIGEKRAVEPLIGLLNDEAVRFFAYNALIAITGQRLGDDPAPWRAWLESQ